MAHGNWQKVRDIFDAALHRKLEERRGFVKKACGDDELLRAEVESLLSSLDNADSFLEAPAVAGIAESIIRSGKKLEEGERVGHYEIVEQIGEGGMGEVYLTKDTRLNRKVALKLLAAHITEDKNRVSRFRQEAFATSALNHPNILTIYEIGEWSGRDFIAAEFVNGTTLRNFLKKRKLSIASALDIALQIASALAATHAAGVVHRDIKPENIMIRPDGLVKILDFGIAKYRPTETGRWKALIETKVGEVIGTVAYMSPEQARGLEIDFQTDIWSLGVILYEMIARKLPFSGKTKSDRIAAILEHEPVPLAKQRRGVPAELERVVNHALAKDKNERYATAADFAADLRKLRGLLGDERPLKFALPAARRFLPAISRLPVAPVVLFLTIVAASTVGYFYFASQNTRQIESIAVLPFQNASGNADVEYLSDGMTESLISSLSQLPKLSVKARSSVFRYKGKDVNPQTVGNELSVQAVLLGRIVQHGERLTLSFELVDARTENVIWSEQYNRKQTELLALQNEIARDVADKLRVKLSGADAQRLAKNYTANAEAYQLYLRGRFYLNKRTPKDIEKSVDYFNQAIAVDPNYALAYAGLADAYALLSNYQAAPPREAMPKAKEAALKALSLDNDLAEAHTSLGFILGVYDYDFVGSEAQFKRAIELNPNYPTARLWYGAQLFNLGRFEEAAAELRRASEIDPLSLSINRLHGDRLLFARKYDGSIAQFKRTLELDTNFAPAHVSLGVAYQLKGDYAESVEEFAKSQELNGKPENAALMRESFGRRGWQGFLRVMTETRRPSNLPPELSATVFHAQLGEKEKAFDELNKAHENREFYLVLLKVDPRLDPLRGDNRDCRDNCQRQKLNRI